MDYPLSCIAIGNVACTIPYVLLDDPLFIHHWWQPISAPPPTPSYLAPIPLPRLPPNPLPTLPPPPYPLLKTAFTTTNAILSLHQLPPALSLVCSEPLSQPTANLDRNAYTLEPASTVPGYASASNSAVANSAAAPLPLYLVPPLPTTLLSQTICCASTVTIFVAKDGTFT